MALLKFHRTLQTTDPHTVPVLIVGQLRHLTELPFERISSKLEPRVERETFAKAVSCLHPAPTDTCSLYLDLARVAALPLKSSRHNTASRAHSITKLIQSNTTGVSESIVIVCEKQDLLASACAVARAFPLYSRKTSKGANVDPPPTVHIEFVLVGGNSPTDTEITEEDVLVLANVTVGIRLTARIVDAPCNEMNVSGFLSEVEAIALELGLKSKIIRGEELQQKGFGGIYGVGKAALDPPALAVLSHEPKGATETVAWVGKGIVFDTGGLSIKGKTAMPGMKRDCGGAAAILGGFYAAVSCAGLFIGAHLGFDYGGSWMHVDMAAPVHNGERATGYGVALLAGLFGEHSKAAILRDIANQPTVLRNKTAGNGTEPPLKKACLD
uniref:Cytosol aminopeptidase domain-containing protein n=1 Tax=Anopheles coluzzii TaxID=1518534 RepID=A0A8W7PFQ6_ANOCL